MSELDAFESRFAAAYRRYLDEAPTGVDAAGVVSAIAAAHPRRRTGAWPWALRPAPALAWLVLLALLLAALAAGTALVASRLLETVPQPLRHSVALVPTGVDVLTPDSAVYVRTIADGDGILWARGDDGRLVRFDPATGSARTWAVSDDAAFARSDIFPATAGGVWLFEGRTLRWFDGAVFREVIDAPADIAVAAEAPDGSLWAATPDGAVLHWDGSSWRRLGSGPGRPNQDNMMIKAITVDAAGRPWVGWWEGYPTPPGSGWLWRYDGSTWTTFDATDAAPLGYPVSAIAQLPDGAVWVASAGGLARFDGSSWTDLTPQPSGDRNTASVAAGPDGRIWVDVDAGDPDNGTDTVWRFDGRSWVSNGSLGSAAGWIVPTKDGVYVGNRAGIFRLSDGHWTRAWPLAPSPMMTHGWPLLAVSHDELWAAGDLAGLWHFQEGAWTRELINAGSVNTVTIAPDGTLWAAGTDGVAYRRDGQWTVADAHGASAIVVDWNGTVWVGDAASSDASGEAGCDVWTLRFDGVAWVRRPVTGCPLAFGVRSLAIDASGALWAGSALRITMPFWSSYHPGGLARFDGGNWEMVHALGGQSISGATALGTAPNGDVWVAAEGLAAHFDGKQWTVVELPDDVTTIPLLAPDGTLWASTAMRGPAHYDGRQWKFPYAGASSPYVGVYAVAPDGTVFGGSTLSILRFPAETPP